MILELFLKNPTIRLAIWTVYSFFAVDPRTNVWFLVPSAYSPLSACLLYLLVVELGPLIMRKREPLELRIPMALYNFGATALNVYCFSEVNSRLMQDL